MKNRKNRKNMNNKIFSSAKWNPTALVLFHSRENILIYVILLWVILYFIPDVLTLFFNNILGFLILLIILYLVYRHNKWLAGLLVISIIILYRFSYLLFYKSIKPIVKK